MKAIIILVVGLILLVGAGYGGWSLYNEYIAKKADQSKVEEPPPPPPPPPAYVRVKSIVVPVFTGDQVKQFVTVVATLQVDQDKQQKIQGVMPRIENTILLTLYAMASERKLSDGTLVNLPAIKSRLNDALKETLKDPGGLQDVLIQVVMQRNL